MTGRHARARVLTAIEAEITEAYQTLNDGRRRDPIMRRLMRRDLLELAYVRRIVRDEHYS